MADVYERKKILDLLKRVKGGAIEPEDALRQLNSSHIEELGYACLDLHREARQGAPEVVYGAGKTPEQVLGIARAMRDRGIRNILVTRISRETADLLAANLPFEYHAIPRIGICDRVGHPSSVGSIVVASGGTSDMAVCEEAAITAEALGNRVTRLYDVGVAGLHRLLARADALAGARVAVVVAGMEGALASVVGGLVDCPVIAVPTSVGYGASFGGLSALLSMLNSCASGVAVVNIDNGFGAGYTASMINRIGERKHKEARA
jgi:NCAIR mutase (PurE)-related protein